MSSYVKSPPLLDQLLNILDPPDFEFSNEPTYSSENED
jgi:hypothetical protein